MHLHKKIHFILSDNHDNHIGKWLLFVQDEELAIGTLQEQGEKFRASPVQRQQVFGH